MSKMKIVDSLDKQFEDALEVVSKLPPKMRVLLLPRLATDILTCLPPSVKASLDPVVDFARVVIKHYEDATPAGEANLPLAKMAAEILSLKTGVTGAERALAAAVLLFHKGKTPAPARLINETNNDFKGAFIANISSAITSAKKDGHLDEVPNDGQSDFQVTRQGFSFFSFLYEKMKKQISQQSHEDVVESEAV